MAAPPPPPSSSSSSSSFSPCQGRCNASFFLFAFILSSLFWFPSSASTWTVGDTSGWNIGVNYSAWTQGKTFVVGDILYFVYQSGQHDVAQVNQADYTSCSSANTIVSYTAGNSNVPLNSTGSFYYICTYPGHCNNQMKIAVTVVAASTGSTPSTNTTSSSNSTTSSTPSTSSSSAAPSDLRSVLSLQLGSLAIFVSALLAGFVL